MRIYIFYEHAFEPGGAPVGIRHFANALSSAHQVYLVGRRTHPLPQLLDGITPRTYRSLADLHRHLPGWLSADEPALLFLVGYFIRPNVGVAWHARRRGIPVVLHPIAQVDQIALSGKIFTHGCDIRRLEQRAVNHLTLSKRLAARLTPHAKQLYKHTAGALLNRFTEYVATLSAYERQRYLEQYARPETDFLLLPWGIDAFDASADTATSFYRDHLGLKDRRRNFVVWSRLDWHYKGLDRLLHGVRRARERLAGAPLPFRLYLCGPDYRTGSVRASRYITDHGLEEEVRLLLPGSYRAGDRSPLRDADASILLSRWDGSPRALRESIEYGVPIMVSPETNFGELVGTYNAGLVVDEPDDPDKVADALISLSDRELLVRCQRGAMGLVQALSWSAVAHRFVTQYAERQDRRTARPRLASRKATGS